MVAVRVSRQSGEVLADADAPVGLTRLDVEVAGLGVRLGREAVRVSRQSVEVVGKRPAQASLTRLDVEVAGLATQANAEAVQVSRQSVEVLANISPTVALTRLDVEVAGLATQANAEDVQITRQSGEALARRGSAGVVSPLPLSDDAELFLHDWADEVRLRSAYLTDVTIAATGAESRLGLRLKPARSMDVVWRQTLDEFDADDLSRLDRMYVFVRRLTDERFQLPLYPDVRTLMTAHVAADDELLFNTTRGRWFVGARIAVVQLNGQGSYNSHTYHTIQDMDADRLQLTAPLGVDVRAFSMVVPMIDCEITLDVEMLHEVGCLAEVSFTAHEVPGASQLPPTKSDTPSGTPTHRGIPILDVDPDWSEGVRRGRSRQGEEFTSGRGRGVSTLASRSRETHELTFVNGRGDCGETAAHDSAWTLVELFDTRRGRLRTFWHVDQERIWACAQLDPSFVSIEQLGLLDDVQEELQGGQVGLVMANGDFYVRDVVTVQDVATVYRMTVDPPLPTLNASDVLRVARARLVRFTSDEMEESWANAGLLETRLEIIETLEDQDIEL
jgi:hypothetical protein